MRNRLRDDDLADSPSRKYRFYKSDAPLPIGVATAPPIGGYANVCKTLEIFARGHEVPRVLHETHLAFFAEVWNYLGGGFTVQREDDAIINFKLPRAASFVEELARTRLRYLEVLRGMFQTEENPTLLEAFPDWYDRDKKFDAQNEIASMALRICLCSLGQLIIADKYGTTPAESLGWRGGRRWEINLLLSFCRPMSDWQTSQLRDFFLTYYPQTEEPGCFVLNSPSAEVAVLGSTRGHERLNASTTALETNRSRRYDRERLLFYLSLPVFTEFRAVTGDNPNDYCAVIFSNSDDGDARVGLDTGWVGNRFFGLKGPLKQCLELSQQARSQIRKSPLCQRPIVHGPAGNWRTEIREWLNC